MTAPISRKKIAQIVEEKLKIVKTRKKDLKAIKTFFLLFFQIKLKREWE
jgi:hypothetical protein